MSTVANTIELSGLIAGYNVAIDTGDAEASARAFAPDGVCDGRGRAGAGQTRQGPT